MKKPCCLALLLALAVAAGAHAKTTETTETTVWRCGAVYSDSPCQDGRNVAVDDARTAADVAAARAIARRDRSLAEDLAGQRREAERVAMRNGAGLAGFAPAPRQAALVKPKATKPARPKKVLRPQPRQQLQQTAASGTWSAAVRAIRRSPD